MDDETITSDDRKQLVKFNDETSSSIAFTNSSLRQPEVDKVVKQEPPSFFIKRHPFGGYDYIPIAILDPLSQMLDPLSHSEILREGQVVNGFYCVVRLWFNGRTYDGIGAAEFQTAKGAAPTDFTKLNTGAIQMAIPKARSEAIKNAYSQIGDLFGRGLRRKHSVDMETMEKSNIARSLERTDKLAKLKELENADIES